LGNLKTKWRTSLLYLHEIIVENRFKTILDGSNLFFKKGIMTSLRNHLSSGEMSEIGLIFAKSFDSLNNKNNIIFYSGF